MTSKEFLIIIRKKYWNTQIRIYRIKIFKRKYSIITAEKIGFNRVLRMREAGTQAEHISRKTGGSLFILLVMILKIRQVPGGETIRNEA